MQMLKVLQDRHHLSLNAARDFGFISVIQSRTRLLLLGLKFSCVILTLSLLNSLNVAALL